MIIHKVFREFKGKGKCKKKYFYKKDLKWYDKQNTQNFEGIHLDKEFVNQTMESLKFKSGRMVGDMNKRFMNLKQKRKD